MCGTALFVNLACALIVSSGQMRSWCLDKNDSQHLTPVLMELFAEFEWARHLYLIWDGGSSHISHATRATRELLQCYRQRVCVLQTPPPASWLNQGEFLLRAFTQRYLKRGEWVSQQALREHLPGACHEYNRWFAHPFAWSWTQREMQHWMEVQMK